MPSFSRFGFAQNVPDQFYFRIRMVAFSCWRLAPWPCLSFVSSPRLQHQNLKRRSILIQCSFLFSWGHIRQSPWSAVGWLSNSQIVIHCRDSPDRLGGCPALLPLHFTWRRCGNALATCPSPFHSWATATLKLASPVTWQFCWKEVHKTQQTSGYIDVGCFMCTSYGPNCQRGEVAPFPSHSSLLYQRCDPHRTSSAKLSRPCLRRTTSTK